MELTAKQKQKRLLMMIFGTFAVFFTGYIHIWSVYQPYVMAEAGWSQTEASLCFYISLCTFVFGNIFGGRLMETRGSKIVIIIGGGLFTAGVVLSAFMIIPSPIPMYLTYGVMQGFGQGMVYTTVVATAQKWFPHRTGFASGIVVSANGLCGFFLTPISQTLLAMGGAKLALLVIGILIGISWILCAIFFTAPVGFEGKSAPKEIEEQRQYTSKEMMKTPVFYLIIITMLCGLMPYFLLSPVSQTYQVGIGIPSSLAVSAVMLGSVANAGARLIIPSLADKIGRIGCIIAIAIISVIAMAVLSVAGSYVVTAMIVVVYGCYGGMMGSFPSFTSSIFGIKNSGENYGYVMSSIVIVTLTAPIISASITGMGYEMNTVFAIAAIFAALSLITLIFLKKSIAKMK